MGPTDWLSQPIAPGALIVYPADGPGSSPQMTLARVVELFSDGMSVDVIRRSRTGRPSGEWERTRVRLRSVGIANSTVIDEASLYV